MLQSELIELPVELVLTIMLNLEGYDLLKLCNTNQLVYRYCQDEKFWKLKVQHDYNRSTKPSDLIWRTFYLLLLDNNKKTVLLKYNGKPSAYITLFRYQSIRDVINNIIKTLNNPGNLLITFRNKGISLYTVLVQNNQINNNDFSVNITNHSGESIWNNCDEIEVSNNPISIRKYIQSQTAVYRLF